MLVRTLLALLAATSIVRAAEPIRVHPKNPRYFEWNGKPLAIVTSAEHYGAVLNLDFDTEKYLDTLKADGMPLTRIFSGSYVEPVGAFNIERNTLAPKEGRFLAPWKRTDTPGYGGGGNKFDLDQWDPEYLKRLKGYLTAAQKRAIVVELTLFCSTYSDRQWALHPFNPANTVTLFEHTGWKTLHATTTGRALEYQTKLTRYLVKELNGFDNLVWEIQNEPWSDNHDLGETLNPHWTDRKTYPNRVEVTKPASVAWQTKIAQAIRDEENALPKKHLIFQNVANFRLAIDPKRDLAEGISGVHFHYALPEAVEWNKALAMPICCDETGFYGPDDEPYRKSAWAFMMAGGGYWNHLDYSFSVGKEDGTDKQPRSPGGGGPALRKQLQVLNEFINRFDLAGLAPDREAVVKSPGATSQCLSVPGKEYALYLRGRGPTELTLKLPAGNYTAEWVDVMTGKVLATTPVTGPIISPEYKDEIAVRIVNRK
jgi:hypothetical protein